MGIFVFDNRSTVVKASGLRPLFSSFQQSRAQNAAKLDHPFTA